MHCIAFSPLLLNDASRRFTSPGWLVWVLGFSLILEKVSKTSLSQGLVHVLLSSEGGERVECTPFLSQRLECEVGCLLPGDEHGTKGWSHSWCSRTCSTSSRRLPLVPASPSTGACGSSQRSVSRCDDHSRVD